jgi:hypothetical protein
MCYEKSSICTNIYIKNHSFSPQIMSVVYLLTVSVISCMLFSLVFKVKVTVNQGSKQASKVDEL